MSDAEDFLKYIEENLEWFCDKVVEPIPIHPQDKEKMMQRMINLGWLRKSELETYQALVADEET